jgi:hypothetical protein
MTLKSKCCGQPVVGCVNGKYFCGGVNGCGKWIDEVVDNELTKKNHEHCLDKNQKYCIKCGMKVVSKEFIPIEKSSDQVWDEAMTPEIEELPTSDHVFFEGVVRKINEICRAINKINRPPRDNINK